METTENIIVNEVVTNTTENTIEDNIVVSHSFFERLKEKIKKEELPDINVLKQEFSTSIVEFSQFAEILRNVTRNRVIIKKVEIQSEIDLAQTITDMRRMYEEETQRTIANLSLRYQSLVDKLELAYRRALVGEKLLDLINTVSPHGWHLIMKANSINLAHIYDQIYPINIGMRIDRNEKWIYNEPFCHLKAIYFNIMHPKINSGTINISTIGRHPNASNDGFSSVCAGDLMGEDIKIDNAVELLAMLNRVKSTYEVAHLESAYFKPDGSKTVETIPQHNTWRT